MVMTNFELISLDQIQALPMDDADAAFVEFERICRSSLMTVLDSLGRDDNDEDYRLDYMSRVAAAASEYDIIGADYLEVPASSQYDYSFYRQFSQEVLRIVTRLQIRSVRAQQAVSVALSATEQDKIDHHISRLRSRIEESDLDEGKKAALNRKLDELVAELKGKRTNFSKLLLAVASVVTIINQSEGAIIKLPETIAAVVEIVGYAKQEQDAALPAPKPKLALEDKRAVPTPKAEKPKPTGPKESYDLNGDIPF
jgi:hypothetical protein